MGHMSSWPGNTRAAETFRILKVAIKELLENRAAKAGKTKQGGKK
jgi:hypothetical protein